MRIFATVPVCVLSLCLNLMAQPDVLLSNLDTAEAGLKASPFASGNGKCVDFKVSGERAFDVSEVVLRLKLTPESRPSLVLLDKHYQASHTLELKDRPKATRTGAFVFEAPAGARLWPNREYRLALSTATSGDGMTWLSGKAAQGGRGAAHTGQFYGGGSEPLFWYSDSSVVNLYEIRGRRVANALNPPELPRRTPPVENAVLSNLLQPATGMISLSRVGRAVDFRILEGQSLALESITFRLVVSPTSRPVLTLAGTPRAWAHLPVPMDKAAGLGNSTPHLMAVELTPDPMPAKEQTAHVVFRPKESVKLPPGDWRLALRTSEKAPLRWLEGQLPTGDREKIVHLRQAGGAGEPETYEYGRFAVPPKSVFFRSACYAVQGEWVESEPVSPPADVAWEPKAHSGVYPHLAMFNTTERTECGIGAVVNWAGSLWAVTYGPHNGYGSGDKLFRIDPDLRIHVHPDSIGGTPANRMIHRESEQLIIGSHFIDARGQVRGIHTKNMRGRMTGNARHLTDPANKVYFATMEEGFYEVDVHTLEFKRLERDTAYVGGSGGFAHGNHGKGLYSGQGRVVYSNNGGSGHNGNHIRKLNQDFKSIGSLNEWDGERWTEVHRTGFLDVSGPGGIRGNARPETDPLWAIGWDHRSVVLKVLDRGEWHTYRLPKASHTMDGPHGFNTEWPRIGEIGSETERLIYVHGMLWRLPTAFSARTAMGLRPRSTYLKMVSDSTQWGDRIVFACNDLSNETQAIRLNQRKIRGNLVPSISHANLWFVAPEQIDRLGVPIGRGSVWSQDDVQAGGSSDPFQIGGWDRRHLHLAHAGERSLPVRIEFDQEGNGTWTPWRTVDVPPKGYLPLSLADAPAAEWVRLVVGQNGDGVIATFHLACEDNRPRVADSMFDGIVRDGDSKGTGGLVRIKSSLTAPLGLVTETGYYEMGTDLNLLPADDPEAADRLRSVAAIPSVRSGSGSLSADAASVLYIDEEDGRRYRLPRGRAGFAAEGPFGPERVDREVCRERNLFNAFGTLYELPYRNAGGFALIRPVTTHNRRIKDFCSWRGLFVMTGIEPGPSDNERIVRSPDGAAAVWLGAVDDLWQLGKVAGVGGPWKNSVVEAGVPSDPYLMSGYDEKHLSLSHQSAGSATFTVEVDVTGYGDWNIYKVFEVPVGDTVSHTFPRDFNAYWLRATVDASTTATAQLIYR